MATPGAFETRRSQAAPAVESTACFLIPHSNPHKVRVMLDCQRHLFDIPDDVRYVNCAYMSPLLKRVEAAGIAGVRRKSRPWEISGADFFEPAESVRVQMGKLVNAPPDAVALTPAVSYGAAIVANAIPLRRGQNVVIPGEEFPSVVYAWRERCRAAGAEVRTVPRPEDTQRPGTVWSERICEAIDRDTAAVTLTIVHWTDGTRFNVRAIGDRAREVGAAFILDGSQSVGAQPFDFAAERPDALLCAGYKWLLGPYSLGVTVFGERLRNAEPIEYNWIARRNSEDFANLVNYQDAYQAGARRFDVGERSNFALNPMLTEGLAQLNAWTPAAIERYCAALAEHTREALAGTPFTLLPPEERAQHMFGIRAPEPKLLPRIQEELKRRNLFVSMRGTAVRVSTHVYNRPAEMDALAEALRAALT